MLLEIAERMHLERQVTLARVIFVALALVDLIELSKAPVPVASAIFLTAYLVLALGLLLYERVAALTQFHLPLAIDLLALATFLVLTPSLAAWWFLFLFMVFALSTRGNSRAMLALVCVATVGIIVRIAATESFAMRSAWHWLAIGLADRKSVV